MKLLLVSASAGAGHTRAAQALEEAVKRLHPRAEVRHVDVLDYASTAYKRTYVGGFLQMVNHAPELWGYLYSASDDMQVNTGLRQKLTTAIDRLELRKFRSYVRSFAPDVVLSTHFLPAQVLAAGREKGEDAFPFGVVVTDYDVHAFWVQPTVDRYFVATDELRAILVGRGVPADCIDVTGIPISGAFAGPFDRAAARAALGVEPGVPVALVMGGGVGVGALEETVDAVLACAPVHVLAVAGRNEELKAALEAKVPPVGSKLSIFGFVSDIQQLMAASDLAITKPGGLTTSECLAMGLPMLVRDPIPGQEERNCDYLLEAGAAVKAHGADSLRYKLRALLADSARLQRMAAAAKSVGHPQAADAIVRTMLG